MRVIRSRHARWLLLGVAVVGVLTIVVARSMHARPGAPVTRTVVPLSATEVPARFLHDRRRWYPHGIRVFRPATPIGAGHVPPVRFGWPVRPFHRRHVLRATFGEPRGWLDAGITAQGATRSLLLDALDPIAPIGRRVIHTGVDIEARDGTPVYAVESGIARSGGRDWDRYVIVGRFGYWHLAHPVPTGTRVTAFRTVLGTVYPGQGHVHLTRFAVPGGPPVNPLVAGGLSPYTDTARPVLNGLDAYAPTGVRMPISQLHGPVVLAVNAADIQSDGGTHPGLYGPAYRVVPGIGGRAVVPPTTTFRFDVIPTWAQGDVAYTVGSTRHHFTTDFWYRLTDRGPGADGLLHTERYPPGAYRVVVRGFDARGNSTTRRYAVTFR